jgi:hypothetical protein
MHYDPPPPLTLSDVDGMRRRGEFRFAHRLGAYIDVEDGRITGAGYTGGKLMGLTPITAGPLRVMLPTKANRDIRWQPAIGATEATFVQTAGGRPGFSLLKPTWRWPFLVTKPFTIWTTITLTINVNGSYTQALAGASPFPRHWLYDAAGHLVEKSALTRNQVWARTVFGAHTPWGGEEQTVDVAEPETQLERALADEIMQHDGQPAIRQLHADDFLFRQSETGTANALVLDGIFELRVDGHVVGHAGPGTSSANEHYSRPVIAPPTCARQQLPASPKSQPKPSISNASANSPRDIIARTPPNRSCAAALRKPGGGPTSLGEETPAAAAVPDTTTQRPTWRSVADPTTRQSGTSLPLAVSHTVVTSWEIGRIDHPADRCRSVRVEARPIATFGRTFGAADG